MSCSYYFIMLCILLADYVMDGKHNEISKCLIFSKYIDTLFIYLYLSSFKRLLFIEDEDDSETATKHTHTHRC